MVQKKAFRYRLYPTEEQILFFAKTFGCVRFIYNVMLYDKIEHYKVNGTALKNTPAQYKTEHSFLKEVDSLALANAQLNLQSAYSNFFREIKKGNKDQGFPNFKKKSYHQKYTTNNQKSTIQIIDDKYLKLPKLKTPVKIKYQRRISQDAVIKSATIERMSSGKFYVSILTEVDVQPLPKADKKISLDLGVKSFAVTSDKQEKQAPKALIKYEKRLAFLQRSLARKKKGSANYYKSKKKIAVVHERIANIRKDFLHKYSFQLINENQVINIEDLDVKSMLKRIKQSENPEKYDKYQNILHKHIADASWTIFSNMLEYKANWYGRTLNKVDRYFPSSQLCHICGYKNEEVKNLSVRQWTCPQCNNTHDRDYNASMNLLAFV